MLLIQLLYLIIGYQIARWIYLGNFHPLTPVPGPWLAKYTNLWRFVVYMRGNAHQIDQDLHRQYGPVIRMGPSSLSFSSYDAYCSIYGNDKDFEKGDFFDFGRLPDGSGSIFSARTAVEHRDLRRRVLHNTLSGQSLSAYKLVISRNVTDLVQDFQTALASEDATGIMNVSPFLQTFATKLNFQLVHGKSLTDLSDKALAQIREELLKIAKFSFGFSYVPILGYILSSGPGRAIIRKPKYDPETREPVGMTLIAHRSNAAIYQNQDEVTAKGSSPSFLKAWLTNSSNVMEKDQISRECIDLIFAGRGSTATALTVVLHALGAAEGRRWQSDIREELRAGVESMPPKLLAVIKETLRLRPPFPRGFPREVAKGACVTMPDMQTPLPSGTMVYSSNYVISRSKEIWGPDANEWKPQRWLENDSKAAKSTTQEPLVGLDSRFLVFGKGARMCIGRDVAMLTILLAVASVLEKWNIESVAELSGVDNFEMRYDRCDLKLTARPRSEAEYCI